ncbi:MAG: 3-dehydroquinate synthase [Rickettsiales bacterium]
MPMDNTNVVEVPLKERSYPIVIGNGLMEKAGIWIKQHQPSKRALIVADYTTASLFAKDFIKSLNKENIAAEIITVMPGEGSKSLSQLQALLEEMLSFNPDRKTMVVALGGGVVGDLAGFAASILLRGVPFVQIPTTLLSQVDSSVGGKTAVNSQHGKNLIGSFYQPRLVIADMQTLSTLPRRELLAGYAEVVKYGLINQPEFFDWLETNAAAALRGDKDGLSHIVATCCKAKADVVSEDEKESGIRALLNLGHTFGHALEKETGYSDTMIHGEAVALGCLMALHLSVKRNLVSEQDYTRVITHYKAVGLPASLKPFKADWNPARLASYCLQDKKAKDGALVFILLKGIGKAFIAEDVTLAEAEATFSEFMSA